MQFSEQALLRWQIKIIMWEISLFLTEYYSVPYYNYYFIPFNALPVEYILLELDLYIVDSSGFIIPPFDPTVVICYLIWPCDTAVRITFLISHSSSLSYDTVIISGWVYNKYKTALVC